MVNVEWVVQLPAFQGGVAVSGADGRHVQLERGSGRDG